jgi:LacI family repressor for deo operon, udp, cdd, tsx, nupC, and nupG
MSSKTKSHGEAINVSIQDVARAAGVATSAVSRALTIPGRVSEKTRARVLEAANRLGYTANAAARSLRVGKSRVVLIVLPGPFLTGASQVISEILMVVDKELAALGYSIVIANIDRQADAERYIVELAFSGVTDGVIVFSSAIPEVGGRSLTGSGVPVVSALFDLSDEGVPSVVTNDCQASRDAITHLIDLGHQHFLYVGGPRGNYHEIERLKGVEQALAGRSDCTLITLPGRFDFASGTAAAEAFLQRSDRPTAVFCCNDDMAIAFIRRLADSGVRVPEDVSVVGFDGASVGAYMRPSLSSVRQPTGLIGEMVVRAIIGLMEKRGDVGPRSIAPSALVVRESISAASRSS